VPIPLQRLLERIPGDTTRRVEQVKTRFNASIRRVLREETGLRLGSDDDRMSVPVRLAPGLPMRLRGRALDDDVWLAVHAGPAPGGAAAAPGRSGGARSRGRRTSGASGRPGVSDPAAASGLPR
jgi:hypothetical protein